MNTVYVVKLIITSTIGYDQREQQSGRQAEYTEGKWVRWGEKRLLYTLLCVADHHELLADVSTAVHRDEKLSNIFLHWVDLFREEHSRFCLEEKREQVQGVRGKKKRVMICITICKSPQYITPSRTDTGFCSGPALASCGGHFFIRIYWSGGPAVCLFIFKNNSPSQFSVWCNQRCSSKRPPFLTAWCVAHNYTCKPLSSSRRVNQLGVSQIDSSIHRGVSRAISLIFFLPFFHSSLCLWEESVIERET